MTTLLRATQIISNQGHHQFPAEDRGVAVAATRLLRLDGHAVTASEDRDHEGHVSRVVVGHYLTCLKCAGAR